MNHNTEHHPDDYGERSQAKLATSATVHCLAGCGLGEVVGVVIGVALGLTTVATIVLAVILGFVFGFALGLIPLLRARFSLRWAVKQVLVANPEHCCDGDSGGARRGVHARRHGCRFE